MAKTKKPTRNHNHDDDDISSRKKVKTCDNGGVGLWSDLNHHLLYIVMMQLGVVDYLSFSGVCKSWRSFALSEKDTFIASKPPMTLNVNWRPFKKPCYLEDFEGRKFKIILPRFAGGTFVGLTCGYLMFFRRTDRELWLVNPITRHQLHFPNFPTNYDSPSLLDARAILVFSRSLCGWVFLIIRNTSHVIWFSIAGTKKWDYVTSISFFANLRAFKGKIYTLNFNFRSNLYDRLYELRLTPKPKLTLLVTNNSLKSSLCSRKPKLLSSNDKLYVMDDVPWDRNIDLVGPAPKHRYRFQELDFGEMKWVSREKTIGECASFLSNFKHGVAIERGFCGIRGEGLLQGHNAGEMLKMMIVEKAKGSYDANMWYFPHECLNVDYID